MKRSLLVLALAVGLSGAYYKYKPTVIHLVGLLQSQTQTGRVASGAIHRLAVPFHRQEHALSCEMASLKMALAGVGIDVSETELIQSLLFDPTPNQNGIWGNPYNGFVGDIDGKMLSTGYGVYWNPVAKVGLGYRRTQVLRNSTLEELIGHLDGSRPVVVWGYFGSGNRYEWTTPAGQKINAVNGEHARTLVGYVGSRENPEQLILLDPIYGELYWDVNRFMENWRALENGAVAVYNLPRWVKSSNDSTVWELSADGTSKYALAMDWDSFLAQGGVGMGIKIVEASWLDSLRDGGVLESLPLM